MSINKANVWRLTVHGAHRMLHSHARVEQIPLRSPIKEFKKRLIENETMGISVIFPAEDLTSRSCERKARIKQHD